MWVNYILYNEYNNYKKTYSGMTNNFDRRIKQHNNKLKGGAKYTTNFIKQYPESEWKLLCLIEGFESKSEAMKAEWRIKHPTNQKRRSNKFNGPDGRLLALKYILDNSEKWTNSSQNIKEQNLKLTLNENFDTNLIINDLIKFKYL